MRGPAGFAKRVVLKTIRNNVAKDPAFTQMFLNEARVAAMLNHPNCAQIFDLGSEGDTYFIAMEFIEGFSLSRALKRAEVTNIRIPPEVTARIVMDCASALDYAHGLVDEQGQPLGLVHRDVSPDNLLVGFNGQTKLIDFGIAKAAALPPTSDSTRTGSVKGKPGYMSPEYLRGEPIDHRSDLFALGVVLYRSLTGFKPFTGETDAVVMKAVLVDTPAPPSTLKTDVSKSLDAVVMRALAKLRDERFGSARALRAELAGALPVVDVEGVAELMNRLWPAADPERAALRALAVAGEGSFETSRPALGAMTPSQQLEVSIVTPTPSRPSSVAIAPRSARTARKLAVGLGAAALIAAGVGAGLGALSQRPESQPGVAADSMPPAPPTKVAEAPPPVEVTAPPEAAPVPAPNLAAVLPAPAAPRARRTGSLDIATDPPTNVMARDKQLCRAPCVVELPVGEQKLRLADPSRGIRRDVTVTIEAGRRARLSVKLERAWLELRVSPWAEVRLDGKPLGTTPVPVQEVYEGDHVLELFNPDLGRSRTVNVKLSGGERRTVREALE